MAGGRPGSLRILVLGLIGLVLAGVLVLAGRQPAKAAVDPASFSVTPSVVIGSGTVTATFTNAAPIAMDSFISVNTSTVTLANFVAECEVGTDPCNAGAETCHPNLVSALLTPDYCAQFAANQTGNGLQPYRVTLTFDVSCTAPGTAIVTAGDWSGETTTPQVAGVACIVPGATPGVFIVTKEFDGDATQEFDFTFTTDATDCQATVAADAPAPIASGGDFQLADGESAVLSCFPPSESPGTQWTLTVTETDPGAEVATLVDIDCGTTDAGTDFPTTASASLTLTLISAQEISGSGACTFVNEAEAAFDDPAVPNIAVSKVCVGEGFDATFEVTVGEESGEVECGGEPVTALDVDPGSYDVTETIEGADADGFTTVIVCSDGTLSEGTSATVTVPAEGAVDVNCVVINAFGADGLGDLLCLCRALDLEIDIDNTNSNGIGIDNSNANNNANGNDNANLNGNANENKNDNQNENTQDQTNTQDQNNTNEQKNNITSSPEVNIDFDR
jgi:hypothetical protein